jgi:hypothetical protein
VYLSDHKVEFSFATGAVLLLTLVLFSRQYYISRFVDNMGRIKNRKHLSHLYYSFNPSGAVIPILFIAAGIFTVFITGANRMTYNEKLVNHSGGTGGYLLWCETTIPVKEDLNMKSGRKKMGLDNDQFSGIRFVQIKRSQGNDASCLNLNHITIPPLLGVDPDDFISRKSFSFSRVIASKNIESPWQYLNLPSVDNTIYGIADQTVLEWGLKLKQGDTLIVRAESGQRLNIIIAAGLQSSVFQGNVLIGKKNFAKYYPSISGSQILLADGDRTITDLYRNTLNERLGNYGIIIEKTSDRDLDLYFYEIITSEKMNLH